MFKQPGGESPGKVLVVTLALLLSMTLDSPISAQDRLRVGVWNIEKLSASAVRGFPELQGPLAIPPRSESDLQEMAEYIRDELQVDALMVTEIEADSPLSTNEKPQSKQLNQVASKMGGNWKYFLGRTGSKMRLQLIYLKGY